MVVLLAVWENVRGYQETPCQTLLPRCGLPGNSGSLSNGLGEGREAEVVFGKVQEKVQLRLL
jgi:hypothetical protein